MNTILKYNLDELLRFLFSILFIILCLRILVVPEAIENYNAFGVSDMLRKVLGVGGLITAALFFYDKTAIVGGVLFLIGLAYVCFLHVNGGKTISWLLVCVVGVVLVLLFLVKRRTWVEE